ncbi:unnamed protein product [Brassica rapa]|uniref:Uncharacterized protein n=2 Tax=Brassica TaxID=3705 RepID=A0A8D9CMM4_BRACM|nr:unnamed protein product [Brassica napus]CAG7859789.1 unnamed protein product [Brassica rapa]
MEIELVDGSLRDILLWRYLRCFHIKKTNKEFQKW